jgi:hypothetical protein
MAFMETELSLQEADEAENVTLLNLGNFLPNQPMATLALHVFFS